MSQYSVFSVHNKTRVAECGLFSSKKAAVLWILSMPFPENFCYVIVTPKGNTSDSYGNFIDSISISKKAEKAIKRIVEARK